MASSSNLASLGSTPEASEFGAALRDMRVAHNTDVSTVASTLRIRQVYLQAIEDGRFDDLPGPTYAAGFVRAYAEYLGLDIAETMQRYRDVTGNASGQAPLVAPSPVVEGRLPTGFILLVAAVIAATAYGSWYYLSFNGRDAGDLVAKLPQQIADMVGLSSEQETVTPPPAAETASLNAESSSGMVESSASGEASEAPPTASEVAARKAAAEEPAAAANPVVTEPVANPSDAVETVSEVAVAAIEQNPAAQTAEPPVEVAAPPPEPTAVSDVTADSSNSETSTETAEQAPPPSEVVAATPVAMTPAVVPESPAPAATNIVEGADIPISAERSDTVSVSPLPQQQAALPETPVAAAISTTSRVVLRATAISWVELRDVAGKRVFSRLLKKGETYNVPAQPGITLATGNAGALDILVDGQTISPIGPLGAVRRDVLLEPEALLERSSNRR